MNCRKVVPVLPALNEIKMTFTEALVRIVSNAASRFFGSIDPSSTNSASARENDHKRKILTSHEPNILLLQEWLNEIEHRRKLRKDDRLVLRVRVFVNLVQDLHHLPNLARRRSL